MRGTLISLCLFMLALSVPAFADDRRMVVARGSPVIDGTARDSAWGKAVWYDFNPSTAQLEKGSWLNYSGRFALLHDDAYIYVAFKARDAVLVGTTVGENIWQDDCVEVWFNWLGAKESAKPGYYQIGLAPQDRKGRPEAWVWRTVFDDDYRLIPEIRVASSRTADGWIVEAAIPLSAMTGAGLSVPGATFNLSAVNRDVPGAQDDAGWNHMTWNGKNHPDPTNFVPLTFGP